MSNKVTMKVISLFWVYSVQTYVRAGGITPLNCYYFNKLYSPKQMTGDFGEFSLSTIVQISCGFITQALKPRLSPREKTL